MRKISQYTFLVLLSMMVFSGSGFCQNFSENLLRSKVDAVILEAYQSVSSAFPCKLKAGGKPKMLSWEGVEKCFHKAYKKIDWEALSRKLQKIREEGRYQKVDMTSAIEASLKAHALPFDKVFLVKNEKALLPLSNSILRSLPEESLLNLPVYDKEGKQVGTFAGGYTYEKMGAISGNIQRHSLFQYTDSNGKMHSSSDRLLLDSYGVPWKDAKAQPGFRLTSERLMPKH
ncbi:MAG: hypothetical protein QUT30_00600 [Acidobacteriota bacterium]|nr:hypothetical protein [Acidobacteriota bacterium]